MKIHSNLQIAVFMPFKGEIVIDSGAWVVWGDTKSFLLNDLDFPHQLLVLQNYSLITIFCNKFFYVI
jgi:hypothetical protein